MQGIQGRDKVKQTVKKKSRSGKALVEFSLFPWYGYQARNEKTAPFFDGFLGGHWRALGGVTDDMDQADASS